MATQGQLDPTQEPRATRKDFSSAGQSFANGELRSCAAGHGILPVDYDKVVENIFTGQKLELPRPHGMSGGGMWRTRFKGSTNWTPERLRVVGILTDFNRETREVFANPIQNIYHLIRQAFTLPRVP
jgi:hypothetical protein